MIRRPPRYTRTDTLFPYTTLFRSILLRPSATRTTAAPFYPAAAERRLVPRLRRRAIAATFAGASGRHSRSEEHTSELQSLMRISYAVFCLKKIKNNV